MKHLTLKTAALLIGTVMVTTTFAQDTKDTDKAKDKSKDKLEQYDEIIIKKKSENDNDNKKVIIEINNGVVTVNGKPLAEFQDDELSVRQKKVIIHGEDGDMAFTLPPAPPSPPSPFRVNPKMNFNFDNSMSKRGFLGVKTEKDNGAKITEITPESAAQKAGLKEGDIITKVDDVVVNSPEDLSKAIGSYKPEEKVTITYKRGKKEQKTTTTLGKRDVNDMYNFPMPEGDFDMDLSGLDALKGLGDMKQFYYRGPNAGGGKLGIKAQDTEDGKGVKVIDVDDSSNAGKAGIKKGDVITSFDGKNINNTDELIGASRQARDKSSISVKINRNGKMQDVEIKIPKKLKIANL